MEAIVGDTCPDHRLKGIALTYSSHMDEEQRRYLRHSKTLSTYRVQRHTTSRLCRRSKALYTFRQSRFGIGDVYFLAMSMGKCEVIVDDVKRLSSGTVHLESGRDLKARVKTHGEH